LNNVNLIGEACRMEWANLLSHKRLCDPDTYQEKSRSPFQQDIDRITFSTWISPISA
jgi:hypothetical protein